MISGDLLSHQTRETKETLSSLLARESPHFRWLESIRVCRVLRELHWRALSLYQLHTARLVYASNDRYRGACISPFGDVKHRLLGKI